MYLNDIIKTSVQGPLSSIGASLPGIIVIYLIIMLFWLVGIHGNNMLSAVCPDAMRFIEANYGDISAGGAAVPCLWRFLLQQQAACS